MDSLLGLVLLPDVGGAGLHIKLVAAFLDGPAVGEGIQCCQVKLDFHLHWGDPHPDGCDSDRLVHGSCTDSSTSLDLSRGQVMLCDNWFGHPAWTLEAHAILFCWSP